MLDNNPTEVCAVQRILLCIYIYLYLVMEMENGDGKGRRKKRGRVGIAPTLSTELKLTISFPRRHHWNYAEILKSATSSIVAFLFLETVVSDKGIACICLYCVGTLH